MNGLRQATMAGLSQAVRVEDLLARMRALPFADIDDIAPGTSLILAPHPDDESLGCGGLIAALCARGRPPIVVCVTDGAASHPGSRAYPPPRLAMVRRAELQRACINLGLAAARVHFLDLPDGAAPAHGPVFDEAARRIAALALAAGASTILATWEHDPHCDHAATAALARRAASMARADVKYYPVWGWLLPGQSPAPVAAIAGRRLDIASQLPVKRQAIAAHASQYAGMITDSPDGFVLPPALLAVFDQPYEVFLDP